MYREQRLGGPMKTWYDEADVNAKIAESEQKLLARVAEALREGYRKAGIEGWHSPCGKHAADFLSPVEAEPELPTFDWALIEKSMSRDSQTFSDHALSIEQGKLASLAKLIIAGKYEVRRVKP
jgi:hypothetical protein